MSPANVLAVAGAARNLVLLGDPQQLLLDRTYRMHPDLCRYTSEVFYDGKLHGVDGLGRQEILGDGPFSGSGLRVVAAGGNARGLLVAGPGRRGTAGRR